MTPKMELCGLVQSRMDPCLFIGKKVMAIIYVDNIFFWAVNFNDIHDVEMELRKQGVDLEQEDDASGFLGVTLGCDETTGLMELKQVGLIDWVIETLGLNDGMAKGKCTPAESTPYTSNPRGMYTKTFSSFLNRPVVNLQSRRLAWT